MADNDAPKETSETPPETPKETPPETPPVPDPPKETPPESAPVSRQEFSGLADAVTQLTTTVSDFIASQTTSTPHDKPIRKPWTHWGSKDTV